MMPKCFQNIFNSYWSDHLTRDRGSANVSKGKVSSFKWNWLVLHARHTDSLLVTYVLIVLEFFLCVRKSLLVQIELAAGAAGSSHWQPPCDFFNIFFCFKFFISSCEEKFARLFQMELASGAARS